MHVLNRGVGKQQLFFNDDDYLAFERIMADTLAKRPMRILSYCLMLNHQVNRYVERDGLRANRVKRAEDRAFGSLWIRQHGSADERALLSTWPVPHPRKWVEYVNEPASEAELEALRRSVVRGTPYGSPDWTEETAKRLGLAASLRAPGRPKSNILDLSTFLRPVSSLWTGSRFFA